MRSSKEHAPYSLYKKQTKSGLFWYVRFWDTEAKEYNVVRSTGIQVEGKRERWREADDAAKAILEELRQDTAKTNPSNTGSSLPKRRPAIIGDASAESLAPQTNLPSIPTLEEYPPQTLCVKDTPFIQYLLDFWTDESGYIKYKRDVKKKPLFAYYIQMNHDDVVRHIASFPDFQGISLSDVSRKLLKKWLVWMAAKKVIHKKKDGTCTEGNLISGRRINAVLQSRYSIKIFSPFFLQKQ